jgi:hypothetical protein
MPVKPIPYWEHRKDIFECLKEDIVSSKLFLSKKFNDRNCFTTTRINETSYSLEAGYFIGVDWVIANRKAIVVFPKLDTRISEVFEDADADIDALAGVPTKNKGEPEPRLENIDYFKMLQQCFTSSNIHEETDDLINIDWHAPEITIDQDADFLTPLLVVKFLKILKAIAQKGLRKSYYKVVTNLNSRIKGKILIGANIKQNLVKNRVTKTICQFEEFGINSIENRLLKKALNFCRSYIDNHKKLFDSDSDYVQLINYCSAAFAHVSDEVSLHEVQTCRFNPFFKEYKSATELAKMLLKKFSYAISKTITKEITSPPYWIDMSKLFELYVYGFLKNMFPKTNELHYHFSTYGNELDFLVDSDGTKMVIDAKYKPIYTTGQVHDDMRQVSGYARLNKVYNELKIEDDRLIDCLIIYPDIKEGVSYTDKPDLKASKSNAYKKVFKLGISLPLK